MSKHLLEGRFEVQGPIGRILAVVVVASNISHVVWPLARVQQRSGNS